MKTNQKSTVFGLLLLGTLVFGFNAKAATIPAFQGTFTLTSETRWGSTTLPAGDYSFTLDKGYPGGCITVHSGTKSVAMIMVGAVDDAKSGDSELFMEDGTVRELRLPQIGVSIEYAEPNSRHRADKQEQLAARKTSVAATGAGR
jgi:hypothetical protein